LIEPENLLDSSRSASPLLQQQPVSPCKIYTEATRQLRQSTTSASFSQAARLMSSQYHFAQLAESLHHVAHSDLRSAQETPVQNEIPIWHEGCEFFDAAN
jgi:hypothetical protein